MTEPAHTTEASHASPESRPAPDGLRARLAGRTDLAWVAVWAAGLAAVALRARRFGLFALGALGIYAGISRLAFELILQAGCGCFWFAGSSVGMIALLWIVQRRFRVEAT